MAAFHSDSRKFYGIAEIAEAIDARAATVAQWYRREKLPQPDQRLAMGPVWTKKRIEPWIEEYLSNPE